MPPTKMAKVLHLLFATILLSSRSYVSAAEQYKTCSTVADCQSPSAPYCQTIFADARGTNATNKVPTSPPVLFLGAGRPFYRAVWCAFCISPFYAQCWVFYCTIVSLFPALDAVGRRFWGFASPVSMTVIVASTSGAASTPPTRSLFQSSRSAT